MTTSLTRRAALAAGFALALAGGPALAQTQVLRIGVTPGPHAEILEKVKPLAAQKGLDLKITEFSDYVVPNQALDAGELDANSFQHEPYLDNQVKDRGYKLIRVKMQNGKATGQYEDFMTGFVTPDGNVWGRPVGVAVAQDGSLLMSDDGTGNIWRISYGAAAQQAAH